MSFNSEENYGRVKSVAVEVETEGQYCGDWRDFLADVYGLDLLDAYGYLDECSCGNGYAVMPLLICGPHGTFVYQIGPSDYEKVKAGHTVRLYADRDYPIFDVPKYYDFSTFELDGCKGTLYKLSAKKWEDLDEENLDRAEACGCTRLWTQAQYAPEMRRMALFVPCGVPHWYE